MRRQLILIFSFLLVATMANGQAVHYFSCLQVQENGDVHLSWESAVPQSDFVQYNIYRTTIANPGLFQLIDSITTYSPTTYIDTSATANSQENWYYIVTIQDALPDVISDTIKSIHLSVNNIDPILAILGWNAMHIPLLAASDLEYTVWMGDHQSALSMVGTTSDTYFEVPMAFCRDTYYFKIEIGDINGCISSSNVNSAVFGDITPPPMPVLDSVSIDPFTGELILGWNQSSAGDAGGYVVYKVLPNINDTLAFVFGATNTSYTDLSFDPCLQNRAYALSAFDTCGNISPGSYDIPQRSILLNEVIFDPCTMTNSLSWTEYINMKPNLSGYRIYYSVDGSPFEILADRPAGTSTYEHTGLETEHNYQYFIRAYSLNDQVTSSSCIREHSSWQYKEPKENKFENTSVDKSEFVALNLLPDTYATVPALNIYRSENASGPFEFLDEIQLQGETTVYYEDLTAEVNNRSYYYYSSLIDSCGNEVLQTDLMRTIFLQGESAGSQGNALNWNAFEGWPAGVDAYEVYRALDVDGSFELLVELDGLSLSYEDNISDIPLNANGIRYLVRAIDHAPSGLYSESNQILFEYSPSIFLPNAFTPGGQNPIFKPVGAFINFTDYSMDIYNRWGQLIFSSQDFDSGWDGSFEGQAAPSGPYVCVISYRSTEGSSGNLKTTFMLLR